MGERRPSVLGCLLGPEMEQDSVMGSLGPEVHRGARGWESEDQRVPFRKRGERHPHSTKELSDYQK